MNIGWRYAGLTPKIFGVPAIAYMPILLFLVHMKAWTLVLALGSIVIGWMLSFLGFDLKVLYGKMTQLIRGKRIVAHGWWYRRRFLDRR